MMMRSFLQRLAPVFLAATCAAALSGCNDLSYARRESPANMYKDFRPENRSDAAVIGIGEPISARQMSANAAVSMQGTYDITQIMQRLSGTYNVAVRWGNGVRRSKRVDVIMNKLTFDEARNYIEDVYDVQLIREGERRLLVLPSASEPRLASFNPGDDVTLATAIKGLAEQCGYNMVVTENKQQLSDIRVTTHLKDVTCFDAFEALLNPHGFSLINAGDYFTVGGLPQRQWTMELFEPERTEEQTVTLSSDFSAGSTSGSSSGGSSGSGGESSGNQSTSGSNKISVRYERNLWQELEDDLKDLIRNNCTVETPTPVAMQGVGFQPVGGQQPTLLPPPSVAGRPGDSQVISPSTFSPVPVNQANQQSRSASSGEADEVSPCGYIRINRSVGLIQMRAPRSVLDEADNIIQRVQDIASRRLLLEARVLAVTRTRGFNQDGQLRFGGGDKEDSISGGATLTGGGSITATLNRELANFSIGQNPVSGLFLRNRNLDAIVGFLENYGTTYELMHPMIELMDRQRATLIDGRNERYFIIQSQTTTGTSTSTANSVQERSQFVGLQFSASAQISDGESAPHTISLQIPITSIYDRIDIPNPNDPSTSAGQAPIASTRLIDQKVRVRDGEIKVIGGLTKTMAVDTESGIPVLRDVAALGKLANSEGVRYEEVEFVVLLQVRRLS